ncbi:MAG: PorV/PorQ family protein [bacterium]|nr:PorV/PorQ family protein [bacterium]
MRYKLVLINLLFVLIVTNCWAKASSGTAGAPFLKIGAGAKAVAMGEAFSALADDITAIYWNPAGLIQLTKPEISMMYNDWFEGVGHGFLGFGVPTSRKKAIGFSIIYLDVGNIPGYADGSQTVSIGNFSARDTAFAFTYASAITEFLSFGMTIKGIVQKIENEEASSFAIDLGQLYQSPIDGLTLSTVLQNVGPRIKFSTEGDKLPLTLKLGSAYRFGVQPLTITCDLTKPIDNDWKMNLGMELWFKEMIALRGGFNSQVFKDLGTGISGGFGFTIKHYQLDYAVAPYDELGNTHRLSITFRFDAK